MWNRTALAKSQPISPLNLWIGVLERGCSGRGMFTKNFYSKVTCLKNPSHPRHASTVPEGHHPRGTTLRKALRRNVCLSEGSAGFPQRALRGVSSRVLRGSTGFCGGPRDLPRFFGGSDSMLVTLRNCWTCMVLVITKETHDAKHVHTGNHENHKNHEIQWRPEWPASRHRIASVFASWVHIAKDFRSEKAHRQDFCIASHRLFHV